MTPTSTDRWSAARDLAADEAGLGPADLRRHQRRRFIAVVAVLALVCTVFGVLTHLQGPKLTESRIDTTAVVEQPGQQLRMFANQVVAHVDADQVVVTPDAPHTVQTSGDVVAVQFTDRLRYGTDYTVTVSGVSSVYQARASTLTATFSTAEAETWRIVHGVDGADDRIERAPLTGAADRTVVWSAPRIQAFEVFDTAVAVVTDDGTTSTLSLVAPDGVAVETLPLPDGPGLITRFDADAASTTLAFSWRPQGSEQDTLYTLPLQGQRAVSPVLSIAGDPVTVLDWFFVPGRATVVVQATDETVAAYDLTGAVPPRPYGTFVALQGVALDGGTIVAATALQSTRVDLDTGEQTPIPFSAVEGGTPFRGELVAIGPTTYVQQVAVPDEGGLSYRNLIVIDDQKEARSLFEPSSAGTTIESFSVSPNGQYLAVETADATAETDFSYTIDPVPTTVTTTIVDIASGGVVASFGGHAAEW
ncbi:hypothetical protein [Frigoribacterium faeni]|uniref:SbsA Ig-like domain-containing protein n=1 Tax=Frigoribacterium faeni TaxID=145483 RepID=A0A7W3PIZ4_9MICO|nr:hypothetical protein [Frigoribacterium faeni]MBA8813312.1 hypothetical protein [Frigoribacterium faeni]GEK84383.1 hypothetical protein FFA01_26920 [Frigoribacterium faeni]